MTATATAAANAPSGVDPPFTTVAFTWIGLPTDSSSGPARSRFWRAIEANWITGSSARFCAGS